MHICHTSSKLLSVKGDLSGDKGGPSGIIPSKSSVPSSSDHRRTDDDSDGSSDSEGESREARQNKLTAVVAGAEDVTDLLGPTQVIVQSTSPANGSRRNR